MGKADRSKQSEQVKKLNRYARIIERIFAERYQKGGSWPQVGG